MTRIVPPRETLHVEFKSDRNRLPDRELVEAVVCLANTEGGELWLGVEDNGAITEDQAWKLLKRLMDNGKVRKHGERRGAYYTLVDEH